MEIPAHFRRYPSMKAWKGENYDGRTHKKLLIVGESFYMPKGSTIQQCREQWYRGARLSEKESDYISLRDNILIGKESGEWPDHPTYESINGMIIAALGTRRFGLDHIAYCNYFQRPVDYGESMRDGAKRTRQVCCRRVS